MSYTVVAAVYAATLPPFPAAGAVSLHVEKGVLLRLAERADHDGGQIWQSQKAIALDCQMSERSVRAAMDQLEKRGLLKLVRKANPFANRAAEFRIDLEQLHALRRTEDPEIDIAAPSAGMNGRYIPAPPAAMSQSIPAAGAAMAGVIPADGAAIEPSIPADGSIHTGAACRYIPAPPAAKPSFISSIEPRVGSEERVVAETTDQLPLLDIAPAPVAKPKRKSAKAPDLSADDLAAFEEFWKVCPKRQAKPVAQQAYAAAIASGASAGQLLIAIRRYAEQVRADGTEDRFIKTPGPWLNAKRYLDEYPADLPGGGDIRAPPRQSGRPAQPSYFQAIRNVLSRSDPPEEIF